jgi:response regulator RpfG family c-di-GMP phosphodiesterase
LFVGFSGMKTGPIIFVDDDEDDKIILEDVLRDLDMKNKVNWFSNCRDAFDYLLHTDDKPCIILCDVNLPGQDGIGFKQDIDNNSMLRQKSIPFVFYSTYVDQRVVNKAYTEMTVQGFFRKRNSYEEVKNDISLILNYWMVCKHPNSND